MILAIEQKFVDVDINEDFLMTSSTGMHLIFCFMCDRKDCSLLVFISQKVTVRLQTIPVVTLIFVSLQTFIRVFRLKLSYLLNSHFGL